jgi:hypothetical protein
MEFAEETHLGDGRTDPERATPVDNTLLRYLVVHIKLDPYIQPVAVDELGNSKCHKNRGRKERLGCTAQRRPVTQFCGATDSA